MGTMHVAMQQGYYSIGFSRNLGYNANLSFVSHEHDIKMVMYRLRVILALTKLYSNQCQDHINTSLHIYLIQISTNG